MEAEITSCFLAGSVFVIQPQAGLGIVPPTVGWVLITDMVIGQSDLFSPGDD